HVTSEGEESLQPSAVLRSIGPKETVKTAAGKRRAFASFFDRRLAGAKETPGAIRSPPKRRFSFMSLSRVTSTPVKPAQPSRFEPALETHEMTVFGGRDGAGGLMSGRMDEQDERDEHEHDPASSAATTSSSTTASTTTRPTSPSPASSAASTSSSTTASTTTRPTSPSPASSAASTSSSTTASTTTRPTSPSPASSAATTTPSTTASTTTRPTSPQTSL
ncbi:unnamed protein product, partial [Sphagnum tenellum]